MPVETSRDQQMMPSGGHAADSPRRRRSGRPRPNPTWVLLSVLVITISAALIGAMLVERHLNGAQPDTLNTQAAGLSADLNGTE